MKHDVKFIVLNQDESFASELRAQVRKAGSVKIVAEVDEPALLSQAVSQFRVEAVLANLDPNPDAIFPVLNELINDMPDVAVFAISASTDGPLILKTMRLGVREFFPKPIDPAALEEAVGKITTNRSNDAKAGKLITITGAAGGVGTSVLATNLAAELATIADGQVTIVDLDYRFGQVTTLLDVEPTYTLADLCNSPENLEAQVIERALVKHESGLQVLSRPASLAQADTITAASCVGLLTNLLYLNDYVVTDGPSRDDVSATAVLDIADINLLVVQLLVPAVRNAARLIEGLREGGHDTQYTRLICNRIGRDTTSLSVKDVSDALNLQVHASIPDDWATVSGAINLGETLLSHSPKSKVRQAIQEIAEGLHGDDSEADKKDSPKKSLIGRIFANS